MKNKNAFTLIELLAVIVILAIIALIATPIILGIVEDARKDAYARSVELVISATDLDVINRLTDEGYKYKIIDGKINHNEIGVLTGYEIIDSQKCSDLFFQVMNIPYPLPEISPEEEAEIARVQAQFTAMCNGQSSEHFGGTLHETFLTSERNANLFFSVGAIKKLYEYEYDELNFVKNAEGMNGTIYYNALGKESYAIHNDKYCAKKKVNMNKIEVTEYIEGECNTDLTFQEFVNANTEAGDIVNSGEGQLIDLGKYGIRYQGFNPNNYIYFNCSNYNNQTSETCEIWRIIGVVDGKVKLIRNESIGLMKWDIDVDGVWDNNWSDATIQTYLNGTNEGDYYASLTETTKTLLSPSTWYLRGYVSGNTTRYTAYEFERKTGVVWYEMPSISNLKVGLMYPSDYAFAALELDTCSLSTVFTEYEKCLYTNWLRLGSDEWAISLRSDSSIRVFIIKNDGYIDSWGNGRSERETRPTVYLNDNLEIIGLGSKEEPYQLKIVQ